MLVHANIIGGVLVSKRGFETRDGRHHQGADA